MKDSLYLIKNEKEESLNIKENLYRYWTKWPWFLISVLICLVLGIIYIRYAPKIYESVAKIKIIDDSVDFDIASDPLSLLGNGSNVNLINEMEVLKSYKLMEKVVEQLQLEIAYHEVGNIKTKRVYKSPVFASKLIPFDSVPGEFIFELSLTDEGIVIKSPSGESKTLDSTFVVFDESNYPMKFEVNPAFAINGKKESEYLVEIKPKKGVILGLIDKINIKPAEQNSDILALELANEDPELSEVVLNEVIRQFDLDGIRDRQLISKRTLDFIDERFVFLSSELDSIESGKQDYKQSNDLSYIEADAKVTVEKKSLTETELYNIETQIALSQLLEESLSDQNVISLLPADIGVDNNSINRLVYEYNQSVLEYEKLSTSAGSNNPTVRLLEAQINKTRGNILNTVNTYQRQLNISKNQLRQEQSAVGSYFSSLPEKEKMLRAIERQQTIKENLFLLLLQKREEAAINFAVTSPSVKIVDYALTGVDPVYPNKLVVLGISLFSGFLIPLGIYFTRFSLDTKVKNKQDVLDIVKDIPILAEIPNLKTENEKLEFDDRSIRTESFRILSTNINYLSQNQDTDSGQVIFVTSAIKGEGKTFIASNISLAYASLKKKVLLLGADLRNPQIHNYFGRHKSVKGLSDYLLRSESGIEDFIHQPDPENPHHFVCYSGPIPPNPPQLLSGENFLKFLELARAQFDYVIVDTAPTILVADTLLISKNADVTVFVCRSDYTEKRLFNFSRDLIQSKKLNNVAYVINGVADDQFSGYNYGYGYGYSAREDAGRWYEKLDPRKVLKKGN